VYPLLPNNHGDSLTAESAPLNMVTLQENGKPARVTGATLSRSTSDATENRRTGNVKFHNAVQVAHTYDQEDYDRTAHRPRQYSLAEMHSLVHELRHYKKKDMQVHPASYGLRRENSSPSLGNGSTVNLLSATTVYRNDADCPVKFILGDDIDEDDDEYVDAES
jgi:hypothetical protein